MGLNQDHWNVEIPTFHVVVGGSSRPPGVAVTGEIDLATCAALRDALSEAIAAAGNDIVIDFAQVTFMGSTGIRELARALQSVERIEVRSASSIVRRALETASLGPRLVMTV
jgi:anti-anti-sigma factor